MKRSEIESIIASSWCTLPEIWEYNVRSNSPLRILDLAHPRTYGIHVSYSVLTGELLYVLITLPLGADTTEYMIQDSKFKREIYDEYNYTKVVLYRKELENV